jgi:hypothetical protein
MMFEGCFQKIYSILRRSGAAGVCIEFSSLQTFLFSVEYRDLNQGLHML